MSEHVNVFVRCSELRKAQSSEYGRGALHMKSCLLVAPKSISTTLVLADTSDQVDPLKLDELTTTPQQVHMLWYSLVTLEAETDPGHVLATLVSLLDMRLHALVAWQLSCASSARPSYIFLA